MEVPGGHNNKKWVLLYEALGTALLTCAINLSSVAGPGAVYAAPITLFGIIMMIGSVSGGHVNPAVSTAVFIWLPNKGKNALYFAMLIACQIGGAFVGCLIAGIVAQKGSWDYDHNYGAGFLCPKHLTISKMTAAKDLCTIDGSPLPSLLAEIYGTFIFTSVILAVKSGMSASEALPVNALAISITLFAVCGMAGSRSGGAINPAVGIAQTTYQHFHWEAVKSKDDKTSLGFSSMWLYIVGPLLGGLFAGLYIHLSKAMGDAQDNKFAASMKTEEPKDAEAEGEGNAVQEGGSKDNYFKLK